MSSKRQRLTRTRRTTPKGEAERALEHASECARELESLVAPNETQAFIRRLNEFLAAARRVTEFLPKEDGRTQGLEAWVEQQLNQMAKSDPRFELLRILRTVSIHDCIVRPDTADHSVEIISQVHFRDHFEAEIRDPETGKSGGRVVYDGAPGTGGIHEEVQMRTKYFFSNNQSEDIVTFCKEVLKPLRALVTQAYQLFP